MNYLTEIETASDRTELGSGSDAWFVVYTKPRQELIALENLARQHFEAYCPNVAITRRRKSQLVSLIEPYFPRYIFLRFNLQSDNWAPVRCTRGVSGLVRFGGVPRQVPHRLIKALKANENAQQLQRFVPKSWKQGEAVEIEQGPFAGYRCIFQAERSTDRVTVLMDIVGKQTRATLLKQDLQIPKFA